MAGKLMADPDGWYPGHFRPQRKPAAALRHCLHALSQPFQHRGHLAV